MKIPLIIQKTIICLLVFALFFTLIPAKNQNVKAEELTPKNSVSSTTSKVVDNIEERDEVSSMRSEKSKTYLNNNGTFTTEISENPIHFKEENEKEWTTIDNTLVPAASGEAFVNKANSFEINFSEQATENNHLMEIKEADVSVALTAIGPEEATPSATQDNINESVADTTENEIIYPELYPNVDVKYTVGTDRVKEDIILKEKPEEDTPTSFSFALDLTGLTYEAQEDGRILFSHAETQENMFYLDKPFMYDSFKPEGYKENPEVISFAEQSLSYDVEMKVVERENQLYVDLIPNREWLESEERVYPVVIDPTIVKFQTQAKLQDTNIRSHFPNDTGGSETTLGVGLYQSATQTNKIRSLLKFDLTSISSGTKVLDATLNMRLASVWNDTEQQVDLHDVTNSWTESGATWANRNSSGLWLKSGGDYAATPLDIVSGITSLTDMSINYKWNIPSTKIQNWINTPSNNKGLMLKANNESTKSWKKFISSNDIANSKYSPVLSITYVSASRLGLEEYWTYDEQAIADGNASINLGTGNGVLNFIDFDINSRGNSSIVFARTYNTKSTESGDLGLGWSYSGSESITEMSESKNILYTDADGTTHEFLYDSASGNFKSPPGTYLRISKDSTATYKLTDKFGNISSFKKTSRDYETTGYTIAKLEYELDRNGNKTVYTQDANGKLKSITDASGQKMTLNYGSQGISTAEFGGRKNTYHYTANGQLKEVRKYKDSTNYMVTSFTYNNKGQLENVIDANGNISKIVYEKEFVQSIQQSSTSGEGLSATSYRYDIGNYTSEVTDPEGGVTKYTLNNNYVVSKITNPLGETFVNNILDENFNSKQSTDAENNVTNRNFDSKGSLTQEIDAIGNKVMYTYDEFSNVTSIIDSKGTMKFSYDIKGNLISATEQNGNITKYGYDNYGNRISTTFADGSQENYLYDDLNNFVNTTIDSIGRKVVTTKNAFDNITSITNPKGNTTFYSYDQNQLLKKVTDANGKITSYEHDENGNMVTVKDANGKENNLMYDDQNQLIQSRKPMGEVTSISYDNNGNLKSIKKPSGSIVTNDYDEANQLSSVSADQLKKWSYTYDSNGNAKSINDLESAKLKTFSYDSNNNVINETISNISIDYGYNGANELTSFTGKSNGNSFTQNYMLNNIGLLERLERNKDLLAEFTHNEKGLPLSINFKNGVSSNYTYDKAQQLEVLSVKKSDLTLLEENFKYDLNGNITLISSTNRNAQYSYDSLNQLKSQILPNNTLESYEYDGAGNRIKKVIQKNGETIATPYVYNGNNQLITVDGNNYLYDKNGNRTKDNRFVYSYNSFDELIKVNNSNGTNIALYKYDEEGRRTSKNVGGKVTNFHYNQGINVLFETDANGNILTEYSYDQNGFPMTMTKNNETFYYILNGHKDVVGLTNATGQAVATYSYDAWGNIIEQSGPMASDNPYRYAGYRYDDETNHYYLIARYYNPSEGVFISLDPVAGETTNPMSQNGYNYANNNPVMYIDPEGELAWWIASAIVGGVLNALPVILRYLKKHRTLRGLNWWRVGTAFAVGAITGIGGMGLYRAIGKAGGTLLTRVIGMAAYGPKAYILNTVAQGRIPTFRGVYQSYLSSGIISGLSLVGRAKYIWKSKNGMKALRRYVRAI